MKKRITVWSAALALILCPLAAGAQNLLIKNATVLTVTRGILPKGDILILGGIIREIGEDIEAPKGVRVVDATGKFAVPGLFDSHTHIGLTDLNEMGETVTPEVSVADALNAEDTRIYYCLTGGVTMVHTMHGSGNPIGGRNVTLKMKWGKAAEEMVVPQAFPTIKFAQGENIKQSYYNPPTARYPKSRMGVAAIVRRELLKARSYTEEWDRYRAAVGAREPGVFLIPPRKDLRLEALADVLRGRLLVRCHTYRADETLEMVNLSRELGFKIACLDHASEAFKIARELAAAGIGISVFADSWSYKLETAEGIAYNAAACAKKGVLVSLNSDGGPQMQYMFNEAAKTMKFGGLPADEALKLITINPAIQLGVDKIAGSLEAGKHGDVALFNRHPLDSYARCEMTIIEGEVYFDRDQAVKERQEKKSADAEKDKAGKEA
jgi:imidazolonepropionase-like amidohydrolase